MKWTKKLPGKECLWLHCIIAQDYYREDSANENLRLRRRIAELESVVRGLKNSPHPRWASSGLPTDELPKMYRRRNRDSKTDSESDIPVAEDHQGNQDSNCVEALIPDTSFPATSNFAGVMPPSSESIFIPTVHEQSLVLPFPPDYQPPPDSCTRFDLSFFLDPSSVGSPGSSSLIEPGQGQSLIGDAWAWNR
jgi:hypothetical protein